MTVSLVHIRTFFYSLRLHTYFLRQITNVIIWTSIFFLHLTYWQYCDNLFCFNLQKKIYFHTYKRFYPKIWCAWNTYSELKIDSSKNKKNRSIAQSLLRPFLFKLLNGNFNEILITCDPPRTRDLYCFWAGSDKRRATWKYDIC